MDQNGICSSCKKSFPATDLKEEVLLGFTGSKHCSSCIALYRQQTILFRCREVPKTALDIITDRRDILGQIGKSNFYLWGDTGCGKTVIMANMARHYAAECFIKWIRPAEFMSLLVRRMKYPDPEEKNEFELLDEVKRFNGWVFLDDLGIEKNSDFSNRNIYEIIDYRLGAQLPIGITSNLNIMDIYHNISSRYASRIIEACKVIEVKGPDRRL